MRSSRFISLIFLMLALAFFCVPLFRQALLAPLGLANSDRIRTPDLRDLGREAAEGNDAQTLAFVALHLPNQYGPEIRKAAERAVTREPSLTWIYHHLAIRYAPEWDRPEVAEEVRTWASRLVTWDPENAAPYLLQSELIRRQRGSSWLQGQATDSTFLDRLMRETEWRTTMKTAFSRARYDLYAVSRFELERQVLRQQGWDNPSTMFNLMRQWPTPDLGNIGDYANLLIHKLGPDAKAAGGVDGALAHYWNVVHFSQRLRLEGRTQAERFTGEALRIRGYHRLIPLLKKVGRPHIAATLEYDLVRLQDKDALAGKLLLAHSSNYNWSAFLLNMFARLVLIFLVLSLGCTLYVTAKQVYRVQIRGKLWQIITVAENYTTVLFFVFCLSLFLTYSPYAQNFAYYMTAEGAIESFQELSYNSLPSYSLPPRPNELELQNPFRSYWPWALLGFPLAILVGLWSKHLYRKPKPQ